MALALGRMPFGPTNHVDAGHWSLATCHCFFGGLLALDRALQVAHKIYAHMAALHLHHHFLRGAAVIVDEIKIAAENI